MKKYANISSGEEFTGEVLIEYWDKSDTTAIHIGEREVFAIDGELSNEEMQDYFEENFEEVV